VDHGYKGKGVLLHLLIDAKGQGIAITTTPASGDEKRELGNLLQRLPKRSLQGRMTILEADKGYDAGWLRQILLGQGVFPLIPYRKIKGRVAPSMQEVCDVFKLIRRRWMVERAFAWLKRRYRRLLLRWERLPEIWAGFATLGVAYNWIKILFG
jgi:transposase